MSPKPFEQKMGNTVKKGKVPYIRSDTAKTEKRNKAEGGKSRCTQYLESACKCRVVYRARGKAEQNHGG